MSLEVKKELSFSLLLLHGLLFSPDGVINLQKAGRYLVMFQHVLLNSVVFVIFQPLA